MNRRTLITSLAAAGAAPQLHGAEDLSAIVRVNDEVVDSYLERQNTDPRSRWRGSIPDAYGLHQPGSASGVLIRGLASLHHADSKHHGSAALRRRVRLAAEHLQRVQTADGNFDLLTTNFNSPPDTAFIMLNVGKAALVARNNNDAEVLGWMEPCIRKAGDGLVRGGVHTPNHRWVACAALAILNTLHPEAAYVRRIDQWLAEGIDIDEDGQYSEQSTTVYNAVTNNALVEIDLHLDRKELLEPVRRNLETMLYLLHPGHEVVTEVSRRQDRNTIGDMRRYWLALRYLARIDSDGRFEKLARAFEPRSASLAHLMVYPELSQPAPAEAELPDDYERHFPRTDFIHIRRGETSASISLAGRSRFFALRRGAAVINGVRFASAFFGKGQFVPREGGKRGNTFRLEQELEAAYYQPFDPPRRQPWGVESWYALRPGREATEVNRIRYVAEITEQGNGFDLRVLAQGTDSVPVAVEINLRDGGTLDGLAPAPRTDDAFLLPAGKEAVYTRDGDRIRFGPGLAETGYTQVRGAEPKLPGRSVYLTGYTPFDHTIEFRWS